MITQSIAAWRRVVRLCNSWLQHGLTVSQSQSQTPPVTNKSIDVPLLPSSASEPRQHYRFHPVSRRIIRSNIGFCWGMTECFTENNIDCPSWSITNRQSCCLVWLLPTHPNKAPSLHPSFPKPEEAFPAAKWPIIVLAVCP